MNYKISKDTGNAQIANTVRCAVVQKKRISFCIVINVIKLSILFANLPKSHVYQTVDGDVLNALNASFVTQRHFSKLKIF